MQFSLITPVLDDAAAWQAQRSRLQSLLAAGDAEWVVVDGGSRDDTAAQIAAAGLPLLQADGGRGPQLNAGAAAARGDILIFLHVDTVLPATALADVAAALRAGDRCWGRFDVHIAGRSRLLPLVAWLMNRRSRLTGICTGDQVQFMTRAAFAAVGGFPAQPLMEDVEISRRLLRLSRPACLRTPVITSGRRWDSRGAWRTILLMWRLRWQYWRGVPAERIAEAYR